jgi:ABC-type multidrug transport system fused ATPase/permease subunit
MFAVVETILAIILIGVLSEIFHLIESFMSTFPIFKDFISILLWALIVFVFVCIILFLRKIYVDYKNTTLEKLKTEQQTIEKIKQLAQDYVKIFIEQGKSEFTYDDLKDFTVIVKFKNGITIPKLKRYSYKEHALLLNILEETYNQLINKFEFKE